ncbi:hypothetical protein GECvBN6_gp196 [Salmonella phage GEC_vB_N6]|nr:hypothetical protein GECvBN6_gp196 [Salmonella phage GEC_vB_N6]
MPAGYRPPPKQIFVMYYAAILDCQKGISS